MSKMEDAKSVVAQLSVDEQLALRLWLDELAAGAEAPLLLSPAEEVLLGQARDDFKHGRTVTLDDYKAELDGLFASLRAPATTP